MSFYLTRHPSDGNPHPILKARPSIDWEARAVFNPAVVYGDGLFRMLYRTYPKTLSEAEPRLHRPGFYFHNQISSIGYAESIDGFNFDLREEPFIAPSEDYDRYGCEDPRITKLGDTYYITYTAIDAPIHEALGSRARKPNIRIALATTKDFITIVKHGIIGPPEQSKAAALFTHALKDGSIGLALTVSSDSVNSHVAIRYFGSINDLLTCSNDAWKEFLLSSKETAALKTAWWLHRGPELGAPPVITERGWLVIFSAESMSDTWTVGAALLDRNEPHKLIARTPGSILQPVTAYEREGLVDNVTFPSGAVIVGDKLHVYYGAADTVIGLATCNLDDLLDYIESFKDKEAHSL